MHRRSIFSLFPLDTSSTPAPNSSCEEQKMSLEIDKYPLGDKLSLWRTTALKNCFVSYQITHCLRITCQHKRWRVALWKLFSLWRIWTDQGRCRGFPWDTCPGDLRHIRVGLPAPGDCERVNWKVSVSWCSQASRAERMFPPDSSLYREQQTNWAKKHGKYTVW